MARYLLKTRKLILVFSLSGLLYCSKSSDSDLPSKQNSGDVKPCSSTVQPLPQGQEGFGPSDTQNPHIDSATQPTGGGDQAANSAINSGAGSTVQPTTYLAGQTTYEVAVKPIVEKNCFSCHSGQAGMGLVDLQDYNNVANLKYDIMRVVKKDPQLIRGHESLNLTAQEIALFDAWQSSGFPRGDASSQNGNVGTGSIPLPSTTGTSPNTSLPGTSSPVVDNPSNGYPCDGPGVQTQQPPTVITNPSTETNDPDAASVTNILLNPQEKQQCDQSQLVFDRKNKVCFPHKIDMSWCQSRDQIAQKFQELAQSGVAIGQAIQQKESEGYVIDQCGLNGNQPIVTMYKIDLTQKAIASVSFKPANP